MAGYLWFRRHFYSLPSILKRMRVSRAQILHNIVVNLGYTFALYLYQIIPSDGKT